MRPLQSDELLQIFDWGQSCSAAKRGLLMLSFIYTEQDLASLSQLSLGHRNASLLQLREATFGESMSGVSSCPTCGEKLEFSLSTRELRQVSLESSRAGCDEYYDQHPVGTANHQLMVGQWQCTFRTLNSEDLLFLEQVDEQQKAVSHLVRRCLINVQQEIDGELREIEENAIGPDLFEELVAHLSEAIAHHDPLAETLFHLCCPSCQTQWETTFDIVTFLWTEIEAQARRLMWEVHYLASSYGWRESDILAMSAGRRWSYLEMVMQQ